MRYENVVLQILRWSRSAVTWEGAKSKWFFWQSWRKTPSPNSLTLKPNCGTYSTPFTIRTRCLKSPSRSSLQFKTSCWLSGSKTERPFTELWTHISDSGIEVSASFSKASPNLSQAPIPSWSFEDLWNYQIICKLCIFFSLIYHFVSFVFHLKLYNNSVSDGRPFRSEIFAGF